MVTEAVVLETFSAAFARYLQHAETYRGLRPKTIDAYTRDGERFGQFLEEHGLPRNVGEITSPDVQAWANSMAGCAATTIRRRVYAIRGFFSFLQRKGTIRINPAADVALPKRRRKRPDIPMQEQCQRLLASAHTSIERPIISLLLMAGLRRAELLGLNADDVVDDCSELRVIGKGEVERLVPLPDDAQAAVVRYIEMADIRSSALFRNQTGKRRGNTTLQRLWKRLLRRADLTDQGIPTSRGGKRWTQAAVKCVIENPAHAGLLERDGELVEGQDRRLHEDMTRLESKLEKRLDEYRFWSRERYEGKITPLEWELHREHLMEERTRLEEQLEETTATLRSSEQRTAELQQSLHILDDFDVTFDGLTLDQQREMVQLLVPQAEMSQREDVQTMLAFTVRALGEFERIPPRLTGDDIKMTPRQMEAYMLWADGHDRHAIGRKMSVSAEVASQYLSVGKSRVGADSREEAYEIVRDDIETNRDLIALNRPRRRRTADRDRPTLTETQKEVLSLYAEGLSGSEIAERLGIGSDVTVYVHLKNCRDRLGRATNEEAVKHAREMGYIA